MANQKKHTLGLSDLYSLGVGQVIGAGVVTVLGSAIAVTGKSAWLAYLVAVIVGFMNIWPNFVVASMSRLRGGSYSMVSATAHPVCSGIVMWATIPQSFSLALFGISLGMYMQSLIPSLDPKLVGIVIVTFFYILNLLKINNMAKFQKIMTVVLIGSLALFCLFGLPKVGSAPFEFSSSDYLMGGTGGFVTAVILLVYSTTSYYMTINYSENAKNPKKDVPNAMWLSLLTIAIFYSLIGIVASGVLPIDEVAGKPLTYVAKAIFPTPLFLFFIVGGVIMALATTLNSMFGSLANVCLAGARDGWFPEKMASRNRFGRPWILLTIMYAISVLPIVLGLNVKTVTNNIVFLTYMVRIITAISYYLLPLKYPKQCESSKYYGNKTLFYIGITISNISLLVVTVLSASALTPTLVIVSVTAILICVICSIWRYKAGKVHMANVFILDDEEDEE